MTPEEEQKLIDMSDHRFLHALADALEQSDEMGAGELAVARLRDIANTVGAMGIRLERVLEQETADDG